MHAPIKPRYVPQPYQDSAQSGRLILRDGTTAEIRLAEPDDQRALCDFFGRLSPESRQRRFSSFSLPQPELIASLCDSSNPRSAIALVVIRTYDGKPRIIATGSYGP